MAHKGRESVWENQLCTTHQALKRRQKGQSKPNHYIQGQIPAQAVLHQQCIQQAILLCHNAQEVHIVWFLNLIGVAASKYAAEFSLIPIPPES